MNEILKFLIAMSATGSVLAIILFAIKPIINDRFSKSWQYYIWIIVIIRMLIPFAPKVNMMPMIYDNIGSSTLIEEKGNTIEDGKKSLEIYESDQPTVKENNRGNIMGFLRTLYDNLFFIWFSIVLVSIIKKVTAYRSFIRYVKAGRKQVTNQDTLELFSHCCKERRIKVQPQLYTNKLISSPMLVGVLKPFVIIPEEEISKKHLQYIFFHELTHLKRFDILYKWFVQLTVSIHWFNPFVYIMKKEINKACEFSCDESVLALINEENKKAYGDTLIHSLEISGPYKSEIISMTLGEDAALLKERLKSIVKFSPKSKKVKGIAILFTCIFTFNVLWFGISPVSFAQQDNNSISHKEITKGDVDECALEIIKRTGNWRYVEPLLPYMTSIGVENVLTLYTQKTGEYENIKISNKYSNKSKRGNDTEDTQSINKTYEILAYELIDATEDLYSSIAIFEFMNKKEIDKLVIEYMDKTQEIYKLHDVHTYMSQEAIDSVILEYLNKTSDVESVKTLISIMSDKGAKEVSKKY